MQSLDLCVLNNSKIDCSNIQATTPNLKKCLAEMMCCIYYLLLECISAMQFWFLALTPVDPKTMTQTYCALLVAGMDYHQETYKSYYKNFHQNMMDFHHYSHYKTCMHTPYTLLSLTAHQLQDTVQLTQFLKYTPLLNVWKPPP